MVFTISIYLSKIHWDETWLFIWKICKFCKERWLENKRYEQDSYSNISAASCS